jgi:hemolysin activation/secretion protein
MRTLVALAVGIAVGAPVAAIDAGAQLGRFQDETQRRMQESRPKAVLPAELPPSPSKAAAAASDKRVYVAGFEVHGVTQFSEDEISAVLQRFTGRPLSTADLHDAANVLMRHYREAGFMLAKVFLPPQTFHETVLLDVEEGYLEPGGIEVVDKGTRVRPEAVQAILDSQLYFDRPLKRHDLERALLLADDLPGTRIGSVIYPGTEVGTARLRSVMSDEPLLSGNVDIDNFNNRQLGQERLGATLYLNSPGGVGDQVVTRLVTSGARSNYAYLTYLRPIGSSGARIGASVDHYRYDATALYDGGNINGWASDLRLYATYPLIRSRYTNLNLRTDLSQFRIVDRNPDNPAYAPPTPNPFAHEERRISLLQMSLGGDETHDALPNGTTFFEATLTGGQVDIRGDANYQSFDASGTPFYTSGPQTQGSFARFNYRLQRLQHLHGDWSAYASLTGQLASGNLDASQRFYLGGATSLAGYPVGEASGDQGNEAWIELRHDAAPPWGGSLQAGLFYRQGWLERFKSPWSAVADNHVTLKTVGLQLTQTIESQWVIRGLVGWQVGPRSPIEASTGSNSDGRDQDFRAWFQVIRYFGHGG